MTKTDQDREDFETAMASILGIPLDCYVEAYRDGAWRGWTAALAHERARAQGEPVAFGRVINGKAITLSFERTPANDDPLYAAPPAEFVAMAAVECGIGDDAALQIIERGLAAPDPEVAPVEVAVSTCPACGMASMTAHTPARTQGEPAAVPDDGSCVRCGSVPRNASGLCATCLDEDAVRAGEVEDEASQALWRQTLDQERVPAAPPAESGEVERPEGLDDVASAAWYAATSAELDGLDIEAKYTAVAKAVLAAHAKQIAPPPEPAKAEVVVKPLNWEDATSPLISGIYFSKGASAFGTYRAERVSTLWEVRTPEGDFLLDKVRGLPSLEAAKAAAQADYECRILSALATPPTAPAAGTSGDVGEHGWVCWNDGPSGWFWFATRAECEHELSDDIHPATALEKALMNRRGNRLTPEDDHTAPAAARSAAEEMRERCALEAEKRGAMTAASAIRALSLPGEEA